MGFGVALSWGIGLLVILDGVSGMMLSRLWQKSGMRWGECWRENMMHCKSCVMGEENTCNKHLLVYCFANLL